MKTLYTLLLILICYSFNNVFSQTPLSIPYQAIARNSAGEILPNHVIALRFSIIANNISGPVIYSETHSVTTNEFGLFTLSIGHGVASTTTGPFDPTKWNILATFSKVELDATGGTNFIDMGTTQLGSVPFAAVAGKTPGAVNFVSTWDAFSNSPPLTPGVGKKGDYYVVSVSGNTALNGIDDWGIGDWAIHNGTAWEKVDNTDAVSDGELNTKVNRSGDTMTGDLILNADPTSALGGATKQYVDGGDAVLQGQFYGLLDSYIHQEDDGVSIYMPPGGTRKRFGIGDTQPDAPLGILAESNGERAISIKSSDTYISGNNQNWFFGLRSLNSNSTGLNIEDASSGTGLSRFFIQGSTGNIGLGTVSPSEKLELNDSVPEGFAGIKILNTATSSLHGWKLGGRLRQGSL